MPKIQNRAFTFALLMSLIAFFVTLTPQIAQAQLPQQDVGPGVSAPERDLSNAKVQAWFFYRDECSNCKTILEDIVYPLMKSHPDDIDMRFYKLDDNYQAWKKVEAHFQVQTGPGLPITVLGDTVLVGLDQHQASLKSILETAIDGEKIAFANVPNLDMAEMQASDPRESTLNPEICSPDNPAACAFDQPIYVAYFYNVGCKDCGIAEVEMAQLEKLFNLQIEKFNIKEDADLAIWMAERISIDPNFGAPAIFIGDHAWIGDSEIKLEKIEPVLEPLREKGVPKFWESYDKSAGESKLVERFKELGKFGILLAGLIDGLNPCAFATIIFFVSYLTISDRKGKEILITGGMFTLGVFLAYFVVGIGFYKVLEKIIDIVKPIGLIINIITAIICLVFAWLSIKDFSKARAGDTADMALNLPEGIRKRINKTIREGAKASSYYWGAFVTGLLISLLEFACTGQMYLPMITSMISMPAMRGQGILWLALYNLMFIIPLIVVFVLAFFGTTSKQLTGFFKKHAAAVKIGLATIYVGLAIFLIVDIVQKLGWV